MAKYSAKTQKPYNYADLHTDFSACGIQEGDHIIVHSSLKSLGWVIGGAETVIRVLLDLVGRKGTLMMPAQTWKNLDPSKGVHWEQPEEWWPEIRKHWPAFDKEVTPVIGMGIIPEMFRTWPGTKRSSHPARSFCANGALADELVAEHDLSNIFGIGSPLHKLYNAKGKILLIGVGHNKNTSLHLSEYLSNHPGKKYCTEASAIKVHGKREWVEYTTLDVQDDDFQTLGEEYEKSFATKVFKVAEAHVRYIPQVQLVDWAAEWMNQNRK
jgi:aminoglycoside 3-N-acetyltransferase